MQDQSQRVMDLAATIAAGWIARRIPVDVDPINDDGAKECRKYATAAYRVALEVVARLDDVAKTAEERGLDK